MLLLVHCILLFDSTLISEETMLEQRVGMPMACKRKDESKQGHPNPMFNTIR